MLSIAHTLPNKTEIKTTKTKVPLRVYSRSGELIAEFGNERRKPLLIDQIPGSLIKAILAGEDDGFFEHAGIDPKGIVRALLANVKSGGNQQGASTITMQVARNYFLTREKTYTRKLREVMLSFKLEATLSKEEILQLYINKIFLGHRAYGFGAAAEVYFGKELSQLSLAENAILAGLPKAPSRDNPITNPERAKERKDYVLGRMLKIGSISQDEYNEASASKIEASKHGRKMDLNAPYVAEMVRSKLLADFGEDIYWKGWHVYTTIDTKAQKTARASLRQGLFNYDRRHGYRGPIQNISSSIELNLTNSSEIISKLTAIQSSGNVIPAVVLSSNKSTAKLLTHDNQQIELDKASIKWAKKQLSIESLGSTPKNVSQLLKKGDVVYVRKKQTKPLEPEKWELSQLPQIQGALISVEPKSGKILALSGGFDFYFNKYNRATQARRQPGSGIKPFIYSAALEKGYTPTSIISGAPIVSFDEASGTLWRPQNYSGEFFGPTSLRLALTKSMNTVSVRLLRSITLDYAKQYLSGFGLPANQLPNSLSLALGAGNLTPLEVARAYATIANSGHLIEPFLIERIADRDGELLFQRDAPQLCNTCKLSEQSVQKAPRTMSKESNFQIINMMQDVVKYGTARKARVLERGDLAGKTGTTNDYIDAWFSGFTPSIATTVWVGFDTPQTMGHGESGGRAALPIWIDFMREALATRPEQKYSIPSGIFSRQDMNTNRLEYYSNQRSTFPVESLEDGNTPYETTPSTQVGSQINTIQSQAKLNTGSQTQSIEQDLF